MAVTLRDIAQRTGVNEATVSRALNGDPRISAVRREQIRRTAREMGYRPNLMARHLRRGGSAFVGLIMAQEWNWYSAAIAAGVDAAARASERLVLIAGGGTDPVHGGASMRLLEQLQTDGAIVIRAYRLEVDTAPLVAPFPLVFVNETFSDPNICSVTPDDVAGAAMAVHHLLEMGHRDIGFINGPPNWEACRRRVRGVLDALAGAGLSLPAEWTGQGEWSTETGLREAMRILQSPRRPSAIIAASDAIAVGVYDAARSLGLTIPGDLSVIGYDNQEIASYLRPALTTVPLPLSDMGRAAVELLLRTVSGDDLPRQVVAPARLIIRTSVAPPRRA
jgi:LacI family transcriptional regulator